MIGIKRFHQHDVDTFIDRIIKEKQCTTTKESLEELWKDVLSSKNVSKEYCDYYIFKIQTKKYEKCKNQKYLESNFCKVHQRVENLLDKEICNAFIQLENDVKIKCTRKALKNSTLCQKHNNEKDDDDEAIIIVDKDNEAVEEEQEQMEKNRIIKQKKSQKIMFKL